MPGEQESRTIERHLGESERVDAKRSPIWTNGLLSHALPRAGAAQWRSSSVAGLLHCLLLLCSSALAQPDAIEPVYWAYSAYFGTGRYRLDTSQTVYVFSARPGRLWRDAQLSEDEGRRTGLELRVPVTVGAYDFEPTAPGSTLSLDNVSTVSAVPGVEFEIPVNESWSLKPLVYAGWGTELDGDASAWIYWAGLKSQLRFRNKDLDWALVNSLTYVGHSNDDGQSSKFLPFLTGLEFERRLSNSKLDGKPVHLHWHVSYTRYLAEIKLDPTRALSRAAEIDEEWEMGAAFSTRPEPFKLGRLSLDRLGIAYRLSSDGDFQGLSLTFSSLFDR